LLFERNDAATVAQVDLSFVDPNGGWIGLAEVANGVSCSQTMRCWFDRNYRPADMVRAWILLLMHEGGHLCGLDHSSGGVMNPYLLTNLAPTWRGDNSFRLLEQRFGGVRIPTAPQDRRLVLAWYDGTSFQIVTEYPRFSV